MLDVAKWEIRLLVNDLPVDAFDWLSRRLTQMSLML